MFKILIDDIEKEPQKILHYNFNEYMEEFGANIFAELDFKSLGDYIEVSGSAKGKLKLVCDRCLNEFEYDLDIDIEETYAKKSLQEEYTQEFELQRGQFIIDLNGEKEIDVYDLLYQSVILALPNKKVCGINCNEGMFVSDEDIKVHDDRMDIFKTIKIEPKN
jgi:uncharacterized metal-binding protein YceD (DUF177 family)